MHVSSETSVVGVDLGNDKITISKIASNESSPVVVADMMDIRIIPNRVMFLKDKDLLRKFGNNTVLNKSWVKENSVIGCPGLLRTSDVVIGDKRIENIPGFIVKNMITGHVKRIIDLRYPELESSNVKQHYVIVPSCDESLTNVLFDTLGAKTILMNENKDINVETLSDVDAMIMNYIGKHVKNSRSGIEEKKTVLIIDIGHKKTNFVLFNISKNNNNGKTVVQQLIVLTEYLISGSMVDDLLVEHVGRLAKDKYNYNKDQNNDSSLKFRAQCIKLKHQLSMNKKINFTIETPEYDMNFEISRSDFEHDLKATSLLLKKNVEIINQTYGYPNVIEIIGGSSRLPIFKEIIDSVYPAVQRTMNPDEAVSNGATYYGQLLIENGKKNWIEYSKIVKNNVDIQYFENNKNVSNGLRSIRVFDKYQQIDILSDHPNTTTIKCVKTHKFQIIIKDLKLWCECKIENNLDSNDITIDIEFAYNMINMIDIVSIRDTKTGKYIEFKLYIDSPSIYQIDINDMIEKYGMYESMIKTMESHNEIYASVINFIEGYYYDSEGVNKIIKNINQIYGDQHGLTCIESYNKDTKNLKYPLKEIYEFYEFCRLYTKVPETNIEQQCYDYIVNVLSNPDGLNGIIKAIETIKDIKSRYSM